MRAIHTPAEEIDGPSVRERRSTRILDPEGQVSLLPGTECEFGFAPGELESFVNPFEIEIFYMLIRNDHE